MALFDFSALTFRDTLARIVPKWLQGTIGARVLYSMAVHLDGALDLVAEGVKARFPGRPDAAIDALPLIGNERRIRRGPTETVEHYSGRLLTWWDDHKRRGGPYALLDQVGRYWDGATTFQIDLVYEMGQHFIRNLGLIGGPQDGLPPMSGPYDSDTAHWARWWLVFQWPTSIGDDGLWSDPGTWDDLGTWDTDLNEAQVAELRLVPAEWNNAHCQGHVVLLSDGAELWDVPAGTWNDPGVWGGIGGSLTLAVD